MRSPIVLTSFATMFLLTACNKVDSNSNATDQPPADHPPSEVLVTTVPAGAMEIWCTPDGKHWCARVKSGGGEKLVGDRPYCPSAYDTIATVEWAAETGRCGFWAQKGRTIVLVVDNKEYATASGAEGSLDWSKDGTHWLASWGELTSGRRGDCVIMVDGKEIGRYPDMSWPRVSDDAFHYWYFAKEQQGISAFVDGKPIRSIGTNWQATVMAAVSGPNIHCELRVSRDGSTAMIAPMPPKGPDDKDDPWTVMRSDTVLATYPTSVIRLGDTNINFAKTEDKATVAPRSLTISGDGSAVAWWARPDKQGSEWFAYVNGKKIGGNADVAANSDRISLSPNGRRNAFVLRHAEGSGDNRKTVTAAAMIDGMVGPTYDWLGAIVFSSDSNRYAYWARKGKKFIYVVDGKEDGIDSDESHDFSFSTDSQNWGYLCSTGNQRFVVMDGKIHPIGYDSAWGLSIANGGRPRFCARRGNELLVVDGIPNPPRTSATQPK